MLKFRLVLLTLLVGSLALAEPFRANERVAFVGDSITHGGSYHTLIQLFYATRYPELNVACFNVGISGDNAHGGFQRASLTGDGIWASDVRMYKPTAATIMLGMNDVGGSHITAAESKEALMAEHEKMLDWYRGNYTMLLDNLEQQGIDRITLIKSSPYDQTMVNEKATANLLKFGFGKNDAIIDFAEQVIDVESEKRGYPICDFNSAMLQINAEHQKRDPAFTVIGKDRVHPRDIGHTIMAYTFLKFQGLEGPVATVELNPLLEGSGTKLERCKISDLVMDNDRISFTYLAESLPLPLNTYAPAETLVPFEEEFNQEILKIKGLTAGTYGLEIDAKPIARFSHVELKEGVNLALLNTPQTEQSRIVYLTCKKQAAISSRLRGVVWSVGYLGKIKDHDASDKAANMAMIKKIEDGYKPDGLWAAPRAYEKSVLDNYTKYVDEYDILLEVLENTIKQTYEYARPEPHKIEIRLIAEE